jgi:hypothetical protein
MADAIYAIGDFPDDDFLWRVEWIGGVGYNTSAPSDPLIDTCLAQLPVGETNPLSPQSRAGPPRWLILRLERCSAPFPLDQVIVDRDNNS